MYLYLRSSSRFMAFSFVQFPYNTGFFLTSWCHWKHQLTRKGKLLSIFSEDFVFLAFTVLIVLLSPTLIDLSFACRQRYFHESCARNRWSAAAGATWRVFVRRRCVVLFEFLTTKAPFALLFRWKFKHWGSKTVANMSRRRKVKSLTRFERVKTF